VSRSGRARAPIVEVCVLGLWLGAALFFAAAVAPAAFDLFEATLAGALVGRLLPPVFVAGIVAGLAVAAIGVIATYWFQGMVVEAVRDILDGRRDHDIGSLFKSALPVLGPLIIAGILAGIGIGIGLLLLIVPGLFLLTIWALIVPVIVIERTGALGAFGRSRQLVRGHGWRVFGVIVVLFLLQIVVGGLVQAVVGGASDDSVAGYAIGDLIVRVLLTPLSAIAATVMYVELRRLKGDPVAVDVGAPAAPSPQA